MAIVYGKDYEELERITDYYNNHLAYSMIEYKGQQLIFSLAHGVAKYEKGHRYRDVLQKADDSMYSNKKMLKKIRHEEKIRGNCYVLKKLLLPS